MADVLDGGVDEALVVELDGLGGLLNAGLDCFHGKIYWALLLADGAHLSPIFGARLDAVGEGLDAGSAL